MVENSAVVRVLHVDDDPDFGDLVSTLLERERDSFEVETAASAVEGLSRLADADVDCVVSDYDMPGTDGLEFLESVREEHGDVPFVLFTGKGSEEIASEAIACGVTDYLQKGGGTERYELLANRVENAVEKHRATEQAAKLDRVRRVLRDVNRELVRADTRAEVERRVCAVFSDADPYRFAWTGEHDPESGTVEPRAVAGVGDGYLETIEIAVDGETGRGPTAEAVRTRELVVTQNIPEDPGYEPWREDALERGYRSSAAIPLVHDDTPYGVLNVYADRTDAFDERERELLTELGRDVAHAIYRAEVQAQHRRYETVIETLPVGVYRATPGPDGEVVDANAALADVFGLGSPDAVCGRAVRELYRDPDEWARLRRRLESEGVVRDAELRLETVDGDSLWASVTAVRTETDEGVYVDGIVRDVTEHRRRERERRRFRSAVEHAGHAVFITDTDGTIEYVNDTFESVTGYSAADALGRTPALLKSGEHDRAFYQDLWATILSGEVWDGEVVNEHADGERYVIDQTIAPITADDEITGFVAVNRDVTERKRRERELERFRSAVEHAGHGVLITDTDGTIEYVNDAFEETSGYAAADVIGRTPAVLKSGEHDRAFYRDLWETICSGEVWQGEVVNERKDGERYVVDQTIAPITGDDDGVAGFVAINRDVTELKAYERELEAQNERLEQYGHTVAHDLRNPLNLLQGRLQHLRAVAERSDDAVDPDAVRDRCAGIEEIVERMNALVDDLLTMAEQGQLVLDPEAVSLEAIAGEAWQQVAVESAALSAADTAVDADPDRLRELLSNLFRNAVEHAGDDVTVWVGPLDFTDGFFVADDGPGIPPDERDRVLERGFTTADDGTGFGLAVVEQIADAHGWTVSITEGGEGGARFEFREDGDA